MPPCRQNNPLIALSLLGDGEFLVFTTTFHIPPATKSSRLLREVMWAVEELQKSLEDEVQSLCQQMAEEVQAE